MHRLSGQIGPTRGCIPDLDRPAPFVCHAVAADLKENWI